MIFAHLPAGYLLSCGFIRAFGTGVETPRRLVTLGMLASVLPDVDWFYAFAVDHFAVHHHRYATHLPSFWLAIFGVLAVGMRLRLLPARWHIWGVIFLNIAGHLFLDCVASTMWLLAPFSDRTFELIRVPVRYHPWYLNFIFHWSVLLEEIIILSALTLWYRRRRTVAT